MDPLHPARLDDEVSVLPKCTGPVGGSSAGASPEGPEVPAAAAVLPPRSDRDGRRTPLLVRRTRIGGAAVDLGPDERSDAWPLAAGADVAVPGDDTWPLAAPDTGADLTPAALVATVATGRAKHRRPSNRTRRPALYLAAALIGVAGVAVTANGDPSQPAQAGEPVSVAEELGMVQAEQQTLGADEATARLQQMVAGRAQREDAQAAAAQVQADADRAAQEAAAAAAAAAAEAARPKVVLPVQGARLTSGFGQRWGTLHAGIDFAAPLGTPEYAAMDGVVLRAGPASGYGLAVYIQHDNGDVTVYGHMREILVEEGQTVRAGDTIALLGNEGQSTGPHLHFEVHVGGIDGERIDPLPWLRERGVAV